MEETAEVAVVTGRSESMSIPDIPKEWQGAEVIHGEVTRTVDVTETPVVGIYEGRREVELDEEGRTAALHDFTDETGELFSVWGSWDLDNKLSEELVGRLVRIDFVGIEELKGGRTLKRFRVLAKNV